MRLGRIDKETTANIGVIKGGTATNIVPDKVELKGEARSRNLKKLKAQVASMREALRTTCKKYRAKFKYKVEPAYRHFKVGKNEKVLNLALNAARDIGLKPKLKPTGGGSDANIFNALGIPTVIVGVGADNVHTRREHIRIDDLVKGTEYLLAIVGRSVK
jgi:tripeptide aminopeptidase